MDLVSALVAYRKPSVAMQPRDRTLYYPAIPPKPLATLYTFPGYANLDSPCDQSLPTPLTVVSLVGVDLLWTLARPTSSGSLDRLHSIHQFLEHP